MKQHANNGRAELSPGRTHIVVVGDIILDRDILGRTDRIAPDAPVPVLDVTSVRESPGGAGLTALLVAASGVTTTVIAPIADDAAGDLVHRLLSQQITVIRLGHDGPTRRKTRVRSAGQSLLRIDDGGPGNPTTVDIDEVRRTLLSADVILVSDYGAGVTRDDRCRDLLTEAAEQVMLVWDPHPRGGNPVRGSAIVTPNLAEAAAAVPANSSRRRPSGSNPIHRPEADRSPGADQPDRLAQRLRQAWAADAVCVTAGAMGAFLASNDGQSHFLPAPAVQGGDPCGAGDRFAASVAVALARGALLTEAVTNGVVDASAWVQAGGAATFRPTDEPRQAAKATGGSAISGSSADSSESPARSESLPALAARLRTAAGGDGTLVATGGCFDIVHAGHVATLQAARRLGDALVVLINSDASVAKLKGPGRPVVNAQDRVRVLSAFDCVDAVVEFDDDDPRAPLAALQPDIWVKGGDYGATELPETETVESNGGRVVLLPYLSGRSTTNILQRSQHDAAHTSSPTPQPAVVGGGVEAVERNQ